MFYDDSLIVGDISAEIRERTKENMEKYHLSLSDSFEEAVKEYAKEGTELWNAWYYSDFRKFIPSAYEEKYLNFEEYPLKYSDAKGVINFEIRCFERYLTINVANDAQKEEAERLLSEAYDRWCEQTDDVGDSCCEEYIINSLKETGIHFTVVGL